MKAPLQTGFSLSACHQAPAGGRVPVPPEKRFFIIKLHALDYTCVAGFLAYSSSAVVTPVCLVLLAKELSINLAQGGGLEAMRTCLILIILLLSGFIAARWGKARMLGIGAFFLAGGLFLYSLSASYAMLLLGMGLVGLGSGLLEGLINPLVQDQHPDDSGRYLNIVNGFWSVGVFSAVLVAGELLTRDVPWRAIAAAVGVLSLGSGCLFLVYASHEHTHERHSLAASLKHFGDVLVHRNFWSFAGAMFFAGGVEAGFTFWSATLIQLLFAASPRAGGVGTACFAAGMVVGRFAGGHFVPQRALRHLILFSAGAGLIVSLLLFAVTSFAMLCVVLFSAGLSVACFWPSIQSLAADYLKGNHTMLFILLSCAGIPGYGAISWLMGIVAHHAGIRASFAILPVAFILLAAMMAIAAQQHKIARLT